jgi:hypothetical protein
MTVTRKDREQAYVAVGERFRCGGDSLWIDGLSAQSRVEGHPDADLVDRLDRTAVAIAEARADGRAEMIATKSRLSTSCLTTA